MQEGILLIDPGASNVERLTRVQFSEIGVQERRELEKWVLDHPEILGEELIIVSTEFDQFDKSDKRLDILALDRAGKLVIIELKRDIRGTLADLQAIRYAAFCSYMKFDEAVRLRSEYKGSAEEEARDELREFIANPGFTQLDNQPRIILAAGSFDDQELTSCVLWLRSFKLDIRCVEISPYKLPSGQLILVPKRIIPLPEAEGFIVKTEQKEAEKASVSAQELLYQDRNRAILERFRDLMPDRAPANPPARHYMQVPTGYGKIHYEWGQRGRDKSLRVAVHFETPSVDQNRRLCSVLESHKPELEAALSEDVTFLPNWGRLWSAVYVQHALEPWSEEVADWAATKMATLIKEVQPLLDRELSRK